MIITLDDVRNDYYQAKVDRLSRSNGRHVQAKSQSCNWRHFALRPKSNISISNNIRIHINVVAYKTCRFSY